jgi:acetylornithine deacetylase
VRLVDLLEVDILDRRLLPHESAEQVLKEYQALLDEIERTDPTFDVQMEEPLLVDGALDTSPDSEVARVSSQVLGEMGLDAGLAGVPFGSDASKLASVGVPSIVFGPGSIDQAHAAVEYVDLQQVHQAHEFYRRFISRFE